MIRNVLFAITCVGLAMGTVVASAAEQPQTPHECEDALVTIQNPTDAPINYQFRWGSGPWQSYCVQPGFSRWHAMPLDRYGCAPTPYIRFDYVLNDGQVTFKTHTLEFYRSTVRDAAYGKLYEFDVSECGCYLILFGI